MDLLHFHSRRRRRRIGCNRHLLHFLRTLIVLIFFLFASDTAISFPQLGEHSTATKRSSEPLSTVDHSSSRLPGSRVPRRREEFRESKAVSGWGVGLSRRMLGLGSSPPTCRSKCGRCSPCKPVHVPIQPGLTTPLEYYPEAWRCQCRNKLFMP